MFNDMLLLTQQRESDLRFRHREHYFFETRTVALERVNDTFGDFGFLLSIDLPRLYASSLDEFSDWTVTVLNEFGVSGGLGGSSSNVVSAVTARRISCVFTRCFSCLLTSE